MSPIEEFFANLKRLFEPRTRPPAQSVGEPTADRPPPPQPTADRSPPPQPTADRPPPPDTTTEWPLLPEPTADRPHPPESAPSRAPASPDVTRIDDDLAEVRAALEAVAEAEQPTPTLAQQTTPTQQTTTPTQASTPTSAQELTPTLFPTSQPEPVDAAVDITSTAPGRAGDALILTLATPAATFTIARSGATLGRGQENTIRLDDLSVSRRHARIAYRQGGYWLSDLGSMGGTWVSGTRLNAPRRIVSGEVIDIGHCRLTVSFAADSTKTETKKSASRPPSEMAEQGRRRR